METIGSPGLWVAFSAVVTAALLVDLVLMRHGGPHKVTMREATWWSLGWVALALAFNVALWWWVSCQAGPEAGQRVGLEFLTGYLVEKSLAVDNIFVFLLLFQYFAVPEEQRQRVLVIGVLGAIALRAIMIFAGALLLARFHWILYVFGAFLVFTGIKMFLAAGQAPDLEANPALKWMRKHLALSKGYEGHAMWFAREGRRWYTPLFVVVVLIGITDVIFAVDSIPAIFAITNDPFIVLTSNVFAVLGLRAMFFLLQGMAERFHLLPYGLATVLVFIGSKMLLLDFVKIPILWSLLVVALILAATVLLSLRFKPRD
jgi:tellurite resistance protein TerC